MSLFFRIPETYDYFQMGFPCCANNISNTRISLPFGVQDKVELTEAEPAGTNGRDSRSHVSSYYGELWLHYDLHKASGELSSDGTPTVSCLLFTRKYFLKMR